MKKYAIVYYTKTGNSQFLAEELSKQLSGVLIRIKPWLDFTFFIFLISLLKIRIPINISKKDLTPYDEIIVIGPIWAGLLISPLQTVLRTCLSSSKPVHFAVTCESSDKKKDTKYGYVHVLEEATHLGGKRVLNIEAFTTDLVRRPDQTFSMKLSEKIKFTDDNFNGEIKRRLDDFVKRIQAAS
jgi:hypothetical protein